ncbi:MAG TPA: phage holin family protein [Solirubrobacteraceae bacterium]|nr:phage holin family protein [Solirubrobacteraceae bacterium]
MAAEDPQKTSDLGVAVQQVSEKVSVLVREEIELAKAEVMAKVTTLGKGAAAGAVGAVFGFFWLIFALLTLAWGLNSLLDSIWLGFAIVMVLLLVLTLGAVLFAVRKLKVGPPTPQMAIEEGKKIRTTITGGES